MPTWTRRRWASPASGTRAIPATCISTTWPRRYVKGCVAAGLVGMRFNTIGVSDGISMGTEGMSYSLQSRDLIADSIETVMSGAVVRREYLPAGLRQEHAGLPDCHGPPQPAGADDLRRHHQAGPLPRPDAGYRVRVPELRRVHCRQDRRGHAPRHRRPRLSRSGCLRRHVHGQHHGVRHRGDGHVAAVQFLDAGGGSGQAGRVLQRRRGDSQPAGKRHQAARHHDARGLRECHGHHHGHWVVRPMPCCT